MHLICDQQEPIRILALGGEIDLHYAPVLRTLLEEKTAAPTDALVLDLKEVGFIDSSGIAAIIEHLRSATRHSSIFCIGGMSEAVKQIFDVIRLEKVMPLFHTREAALDAIRQKKITDPEKPIFKPAE